MLAVKPPAPEALAGHGEAVGRAAFSPDGTPILTVSGDRTARVWDAASGKAIAVLEGAKP